MPSRSCVQEFDPNCIRQFLELLTPQRARVTWASRIHEQPSATADTGSNGSNGSSADSAGLPPPQLCTEPIYGTLYDVQRLPEAWVADWASGQAVPGLHLPEVRLVFVTTYYNLYHSKQV